MESEPLLPELTEEGASDGSGCPAYEQICIVGLVVVFGLCEVGDQGSDASDDAPIAQVEETVEEVGGEVAMADDRPDF